MEDEIKRIQDKFFGKGSGDLHFAKKIHEKLVSRILAYLNYEDAVDYTDIDEAIIRNEIHKLIKYKLNNTEFAGVITKHPLTSELWMRVVSSNPINDIVKATDAAISTTTNLKKLITSKIKAN